MAHSNDPPAGPDFALGVPVSYFYEGDPTAEA